MTTPSIQQAGILRMLNPRRIAIAGYSERAESWSNLLRASLQAGGFQGEVLALRPRKIPSDMPAIDGLEGQDIDLLAVALPADAVVPVVGEAARAGVGGALVVSAGFAEAGGSGAALQDQLAQAAATMPVFGPNAVGLISAPAAMSATASPFGLRSWKHRSGAALVSQSGAVGFVLAEELKRHGVPPTYYVSVGNEAATTALDVADFYLEQDDLMVVGVYLESVRDPRHLSRTGRRAAQLGKSLVILASGTSSAGQRAAQSHTAAVVGDRLLLEGICADTGIALVGDESAFAAAVAVRARGSRGLRRPSSMAVLSMSGGAGAILSDRLSDTGISVPAFTPEAQQAYRDAAPFLASAQNPMDIGGMFLRHLDEFSDLAQHVAATSGIEATAVFLTCGDKNKDDYRRIGRTLAQLEGPAWLIWDGAAPEALTESGLDGVAFPTIASLVAALATLPPAPAASPALSFSPARVDPAEWPARSEAVLTEAACQPLLGRLGAPYAATRITPAQQVAAGVPAEGPGSFPAVLKVDTHQAPHRARLGLIRLGIGNDEELQAESLRLVQHAADQGLDLASANVLVQAQLPSEADFSLGLIRNGQYGDFMVVGPGGADVERPDLKRHAIPMPMDSRRLELALQAAEAVAGHAVAPADFARVAGALDALAASNPEVSDIDFNPVLVHADGTLSMVDSLIIQQPSADAADCSPSLSCEPEGALP